MSLQKIWAPSFWRFGLSIVAMVGMCHSPLSPNVAAQSNVAAQPNVAAQSNIDMSVRRQSGGWQPTVKTPQVQTAYFQAQGDLSGGMPVLPTAGQGMPAGNEHWNAGQLPAFPGASDMPRAGSPPNIVSPPATMPQPLSRPQSLSDNIAPPQLPMANRFSAQANEVPAASAGGSLRNQPSQGFPAQANVQPAASAGGSGGVPARFASTELRTIQNERELQQGGGPNPNGSGLRETGAQPGGVGRLEDGRPAAESFTSGLPYVTPAPRGRYATSPYQPAVFQSSDRRPMLVPAQFASSSNVVPPANAPAEGLRQTAPPTNLIATQATTPNFVGAAPPTYLTAQQAALPQYQYPQPGIYPTAYQCTQPAPSFPSTGAVPGGYIPATLPPNLTPNLYTPNNAGYRPLFSLGQENCNVQLGRGIIGQPTAYVPGQHIRNFLRYLSP